MRSQLRTLSPSENRRIVLGLLVQPFVAAGLAFLAFPLVERSGRTIHGGTPVDFTDAALALAAGTSIVAVFMSLPAALAAVWVLRRHPLTLTRALLFGVMLGNVPTVLGTMLSGIGYGLVGLIRAVLFASVLGLGGAAAFWFIWTITRPAHDGEAP